MMIQEPRLSRALPVWRSALRSRLATATIIMTTIPPISYPYYREAYPAPYYYAERYPYPYPYVYRSYGPRYYHGYRGGDYRSGGGYHGGGHWGGHHR